MLTATLQFEFSNGTDFDSQEKEFDLDDYTVDNVEEFIEAHCAELAEEHGGDDFEGEYTVVGIEGEAVSFNPADFTDLAEMAAFGDIVDRAHDGVVVELYADYQGADYAGNAEENFMGVYNDPADYARQHAEDCGYNVPDGFYNYVDWESLGDDMLTDAVTIEHRGKLYIYRE